MPRVRVFVIDGLRNGLNSDGHTGVNELRLRGGRIVREGFHTTLTDMRLRKGSRSARARWDAMLGGCPSIILAPRDRSKLGYFWKHAYNVAQSGPYLGSVVNPDSGRPVYVGEDRLRRADFKKAKLSEFLGGGGAESDSPGKDRRQIYSALWQADRSRIHRFAPADFIGRYLGGTSSITS